MGTTNHTWQMSVWEVTRDFMFAAVPLLPTSGFKGLYATVQAGRVRGGVAVFGANFGHLMSHVAQVVKMHHI